MLALASLWISRAWQWLRLFGLWQRSMPHLLLLALLNLGQAWADVVPQHHSRPEYLLKQGLVRGQQKMGVTTLLGLPYAAPPVGNLRWRPPQSPQSWWGLRNASRPSPTCLQGEGRSVSGQEDCLYLSIYRPANIVNPPVMLWVHGGFFTGGSSQMYDGSALARQFGVAVVTVNYRIGIMGFLAAKGFTEGNLGLMDIQQALRWLQANADNLGLDKNNVTLFGNSAGAAAICALLAAPSSAGLFHKAILQSGSCGSWYFASDLAQAQAKNRSFVTKLLSMARAAGCSNEAGHCLRRLSSRAVTSLPIPTNRLVDAVPLPIVYGGKFLPLDPKQAFATGQFMRLPVLLGSNSDEGRILSGYISLLGNPMNEALYWLVMNILDQPNAARTLQHYPNIAPETPAETAARAFTDRLFACPTYRLARQLSQYVPTYQYEFADPKAASNIKKLPNFSNLGSYHSAEIPYIFGSSVRSISNIDTFTPQQQRLSWQMGHQWTNFAKTGRPSWPPVEKTDSQGMRVFTFRPSWPYPAPASALTSFFASRHNCNFWQSID